MRNILLLLVLYSRLTLAQTTYFNIQFDYDNIWNASSGIVETDSCYLASGVFGSFTTFDTGFVVQISKEGVIENLKKVDFYEGSKVFDIEMPPSADKQFDISGIHYNGIDDVVSVDLFLCRLAGDLKDTVQVKSFGVPGFGDYTSSPMLRTSDNGIVLTGYRFAPGQKGKLLLLKTDSLWNEVFMKTYHKNLLDNHFGYGTVETPDKGLIVVGARSFNQYYRQGAYLRVDSLGNLLWWKDIVPQGDETLIILDHIQKLENGTYLVVGIKSVFTPGFPQYMVHLILCINVAGDVLWLKEHGNIVHDDVWWRGLSPLEDGNFLAFGLKREHETYPSQRNYGTVAKITPNGEVLWERLYSVSSEGRLYDVFFKAIPTTDGGFIACGSTWGDSITKENSWIVKLDSLGCLEPGCADIGTAVIELPVGGNSPVRIYPNPTGGPLMVEALGGRRIAALRVYDLHGRMLKDEAFAPAREALSFDIGGAPPGTYFCTALVGGVWVTRQVVIQ